MGGICAEGAATYTRKQLDALTDFVKKPQIYSLKKNIRRIKKQIYKILHIFAKETTPPARTGDVNDNNF
jgi:hypothetical protein